MSELDGLPQQEWLTLTVIQALDALRDGLRPFVVQVLEEKEGPHWFNHPRVQRMLPAPPDLEGEGQCATEPPALDLALLLKLIGSDCYWYRTFRPRLPGISRWQIDSLRELRNRLAHNDGSDPLFIRAALLLPYLNTMEQVLQVVAVTSLMPLPSCGRAWNADGARFFVPSPWAAAGGRFLFGLP